jgi:endoglycosylceramidase
MSRKPKAALKGVGLVLVFAALVLSLPGTWLTDFSTSVKPGLQTRPSAAAGALAWLHVEHPARQRAFIADELGRTVILRGVASGGLMDYWSGTNPTVLRPAPLLPIDPAAYQGRCPVNSVTIWQPPLCRSDLAEMHALGFDVVRLALSWSLLEPEPGTYDRRYLERIAQVVGWASAEGIYVILDMHENAYSRYLTRPSPPPWPGGTATSLNQLSGAPPWAVITDFWPSEVFFGQRELNPAVFAAFNSFWLNRPVAGPAGEAPGSGLQDHYIGALAMLARRFKDDSAVAGYGVFNEPWPGFVPPPAFEDLFLFPFYRRVLDALTGAGDGLPCPPPASAAPPCGYPDLGIHDRSHLFFVEPDHLREQTDFATSLPLPFSSAANLVYSIHAYTHVFTLDALAGQDPRHASYPPGGFELSYGSAELEARSMHAALFVDELGDQPADDALLLANQLAVEERHQVGSVLWLWKQNCAVVPTWGVYDGLYDGQPNQRCAYDRPPGAQDAAPVAQNGCLRPERERLLARVWPRAMAAASSKVTYSYDSGTGLFNLIANAPAGAPETLLFVPRQVRGTVAITGLATIASTEQAPDGSRLVHVQPEGGFYHVAVLPTSLALTPCAEA